MMKLALVGAGAWGKNYIRTINSLPSCSLPENYIKTRNYKDLFSFPDINGVIIATPPSTHYRIAKDFLERGFNVLVEKPFTTNSRDALKLQHLAERKKSVAMIGHIYLYHPAFIEMKKSMKRLGEVYYIMCEGMDFGPIRTDISSLWDWAPHDLSMALYLLDKTPISISAWGVYALSPKKKIPDMYFLNLKFEKNLTVFLKNGWLSPVKKRNLVIMGKNNALVFDDMVPKKLSLISKLKDRQEIVYPSYPSVSPLESEVLAFVDCIKTKKNPISDFMQGVQTVKIIEAAEKSMKQNGREIAL